MREPKVKAKINNTQKKKEKDANDFHSQPISFIFRLQIVVVVVTAVAAVDKNEITAQLSDFQLNGFEGSNGHVKISTFISVPGSVQRDSGFHQWQMDCVVLKGVGWVLSFFKAARTAGRGLEYARQLISLKFCFPIFFFLFLATVFANQSDDVTTLVHDGAETKKTLGTFS